MDKVYVRSILLLLFTGCLGSSHAQPERIKHPVEVMTLGTFHFAYPNLDAFQTAEEDQVDVLKEPWQSEIIAIAKAVEAFNPTVIAVERDPSRQQFTDSLYKEYRGGRWELTKNEIYQLGFRLAANLGLDKVYCVDDMGRHYPEILEIFGNETRMAAFEDYYMNSPNLQYVHARIEGRQKVSSIKEELLYYNTPEVINQALSYYLLHPFQYEEEAGDFTGVDFETGRWFNRNLRIFRNVQRIPVGPDDRILLIVGAEHLNLLNYFFEISAEFQFVSPLPFLEKL